MSMYEKIIESAEFIQSKIQLKPKVGLILGSGLGVYVDSIQDKVIIPYVDIPKLEGKITSYKGLIIEWCQKQKKKYDINTYEDTGNEPVKHFSVKISIDDVQIAKGRATSKKKAEEQASKRVYFTFQKQIENS